METAVKTKIFKSEDFTIFKFNDKYDIRTISLNNEPWFCVRDICNALGIKNSSDLANRLNNDYIFIIDSIDGVNRLHKMIFTNEPGMYISVLTSRKQIAKTLIYWLAGIVIPSIRKTGSYTAGTDMPKLLNDINKLQEQLLEKNKELSSTKSQLTDLQRKHQALKKQRVRYKFEKGPVFYIIVDNWRIGTPKHKVGNSINVNTRFASYRTYMPDLKIEYMCYVETVKEAEFIEESVLRRFNGSFNPKDSEYICDVNTDIIISMVKQLLIDFKINHKEAKCVSDYNSGIDPVQPIKAPIVYDENQTKKCGNCSVSKNINEFYKHKNGKYGVSADCKNCSSAKEKEIRDNKKLENPKPRSKQEGIQLVYIKDGVQSKIYNSITDLCLELKMDRTRVSKCLTSGSSYRNGQYTFKSI